jgi:hypothetical protein
MNELYIHTSYKESILKFPAYLQGESLNAFVLRHQYPHCIRKKKKRGEITNADMEGNGKGNCK